MVHDFKVLSHVASTSRSSSLATSNLLVDREDDLIDPLKTRLEPPPITVCDVYDIAASVGKELELIVDRYGSDAVSTLMPKVITVLEELEDFATHFESESNELVTLQVAVNRLELEKQTRSDDKTRTENEIEQLAETWQAESRELVQLIGRLKEENEQLKQAIEEKRSNSGQHVNTRNSSSPSVQETQLMLRLKDVINRQSIEVRDLRKQFGQKNMDFEAMQQQATRLAKLNAVLRRRNCVNKRQIEQLMDDKQELLEKLQVKDLLVQQMKDHVGPPGEQTIGSLSTCGMSTSMVNELDSPGTPPAVLTESQLITRLNAEHLMIRARGKSKLLQFSVDELRNVLTDRNELQSRLIGIEEEISVYKRAGDCEPPVQGPINREPWDKSYDHQSGDSLIATFFKNILQKLTR